MFVKSVFVFMFVLGSVFVILKGKFVNLKLVFLYLRLCLCCDLGLGMTNGARGAHRAGFGLGKKTRLLNGASSGNGYRPTGRVQA